MAKKAACCLLVDYDNIRIGLEKNFGIAIKPDVLVPALRSLVPDGKFLVQKAYADWERWPGVQSDLAKNQIEPVYVSSKRRRAAPYKEGTARNTADVRLALDAQRIAYENRRVDTFILASSDKDYIPLISDLTERGKSVVVCGVRLDTSQELLESSADFRALEDLLGLERTHPADASEVDWASFVRLLDTLERSLPFVGLKYFRDNILTADVLGGVDSREQRQRCMNEAVSLGIITVGKQPNPKSPDFPTSSCQLNREHELVRNVVGPHA